METLTGRLTANADVKEVKGGKKVVDFTIAINDSYRSNGETVKTVTYVDCAYWLNAGVAEFMNKGGIVQLHGRIGSRAWIGKDNEAQSRVTMNVGRVVLLGGKPTEENGKADNKETKKQGTPAGGEDDDLPF